MPDVDVNATIRFYLYVLPLIMAAIMCAGEPIVWLILSSKFLPVAPLLLLCVPSELMRILSETVAMPLLARRRLKPFTALFAFQSAIFVGAAAIALPSFGLIGAAAAYGLSNALCALAAFAVCRVHFSLKLERTTGLCLLRGVGLLAIVAAAGFLLPFGLRRLVISGLASIAWLLLTLRDPKGRQRLADSLAYLRPSHVVAGAPAGSVRDDGN